MVPTERMMAVLSSKWINVCGSGSSHSPCLAQVFRTRLREALYIGELINYPRGHFRRDSTGFGIFQPPLVSSFAP